MKMTTEKRGITLYVYLNGELDEHNAATLRREVDSVLTKQVDIQRAVFDLTGISFLDSTAIGFLLGRYKLCKAKDVTAYIKNPMPTADKILSMSGVYTIIPKI